MRVVPVNRLKKRSEESILQISGDDMLHEAFVLKPVAQKGHQKEANMVIAYELTQDGDSGIFVWDDIEQYLEDMGGALEMHKISKESVREAFERES